MKQNHYRITVQPIPGPDEASVAGEPLVFETANHDDILAIVERFRARGDFNDDQAAALAVGLKLFGEVMLKSRSNPLFEGLAPAFGEFMKSIKGKRS